jgi:SulP family sulfate permease
VRHVTALDATGIQAIEDLADRLHGAGHELVLCGARGQPRRFMTAAGLERHLGEANLCPSIEAALARARALLARGSARSA